MHCVNVRNRGSGGVYMKRMALAGIALATMVACEVDEGTPASGEGYDQEVASVGPPLYGPSFMHSTDPSVYGIGCAYSAEQWLDSASELLDARFEDAGLGNSYSSLSELRGLLAAGGSQATLTAHAINVAMNDAGIYGDYADFGEAYSLSGPHAGVASRMLPANMQLDRDLEESIREITFALNSCPEDWYLAEDYDLDGDGVALWDDCNDVDPNVGLLILDDDLSAPGNFDPTPELGDDWEWDGDSVYATDGGQEAMLGTMSGLTDIVIYSDVASEGTKISCGFDCEEACGAYEPDDCYTGWQALGLGILSAEVSATGTVTFHNSGAYDVCLDSWMVFDAPSGGQGEVLGPQGGEWGGEYRVPAGGSAETYYGSWTTANGVVEDFLGGDAFWCVERGTYMSSGAEYVGWGALVPEDIQEMIALSDDVDGDGVEDHVDYTDSTGVQTQHTIWDYQNSHAALMVGKLAEATASGTVQVDLHVENRGVLATTGTLSDTLPATWELVSCDDMPDAELLVDGATVLEWDMTLGGCTDDCAVVDSHDISCEIRSMLPVDHDIVELPAASIAYNDGADDEVSWSGEAVAFDYDYDMDGEVLCGRTDRWRTGVLARADFDVDQDEGYHGVRCALSRNSEEDCFDPGWFLQIGAFLDAEEDEISSECEAGCPPNTTFDQLARVDHDGMYDLSDDLNAQLRFYTVGDELVCEAWDKDSGDLIAQARATSALFADGGFGMSTLNMFGDYDRYTVCEAYGTP